MRAILHDVTRCRGCMRCVEACAEANGLAKDGSLVRFEGEGLSGKRLNALERTPEGRFVRKHCLHCLEPACVAACLVGALKRTDDGAVVYDKSKCIGCRYCMLACPFGVPQYEWDTTLPFMLKCEMCHDRPGGPACVEVCPYEATLAGDRDELLEVARRRIRSEPDKYIPHIWGEKEMGGTGVLFISDVPLDGFWPEALGETSIPDITLPLAQKTPFLAFGVAGLLTAVSWIVHRRERLAAERTRGGGHDR